MKLAVFLLIVSSISALPCDPIEENTTISPTIESIGADTNQPVEDPPVEKVEGLDHPAIIAQLMQTTSRIRRQIALGFGGGGFARERYRKLILFNIFKVKKY